MNDRIKNIKKTFYYMFYMLDIVYRTSSGKKYIALKVVITVISPIVSLTSVIIPGLLIDELTTSHEYTKIAFYIIILFGVPYIWKIIRDTINYYYISVLKYSLNQKIEADFYRYTAKLDYDFFDKPFLADLQSAANEVQMNDIVGSVDILCGFISTGISLFALSSLISTLNPIVIVIIVLNFMIKFLISKNHKRKLLEYENEIRKLRRHKYMHMFPIKSDLYAKEVRLFQMGDFLTEKIVSSNKRIDELDHGQNKHSLNANYGYTSIALVQNLFVYVYTIISVLNGIISVGYMSIINSAASQLSSLLTSVSDVYINMYQKGPKVQKYIDYMNLPSIQYQNGILEPKFYNNSVIEFKNVSFSYPGSDRLVLNNVNLKINANEHLAIVGKNGSGKSTFVKLLTRLYPPSSGEILLNGINIYEYDYEKYQKLFSPVFQDYALYDMSIKENIALSSIAEEIELEKVSIMSGLQSFLGKLTKGFDTQLGKNFDPEGVELSGGEGQRLAIARARYYNRKIFVLDEPTAALDPDSEYEIYIQFSNMIEDKTAVLITHRLSAVQLADKVAVFDNGHVAEYGTHAELYAKGGIYTEMFDKQAQFYRDQPSEQTGSEDAV